MNWMSVFQCIGGLVLTISLSWAQPKLTKWEELEELLMENPKPIVVFLYTDWCNYCALMERKTWREEKVAALLDKQYYFISFHAEQRAAVVFGSHTYRFKARGIKSGTHELAKILSDNEVYPTMVILDENLQILYKHQAYIRPQEMWGILERFLN